MTTNAIQAEIPTELMMAGASDTPRMGTDTFYFQNLTARISGGPLCRLKRFAFHRESVVLKDLCDRPLTYLSRVNPGSVMDI